jgi:hypothetical protein
MSLVKKHHGNANPQQRGGVVVLAGDPKQLGPNTRSQIYREVRAKTLLERLETAMKNLAGTSYAYSVKEFR